MASAWRRKAGHTPSTTNTNTRVAPNSARPAPIPNRTASVPETRGHRLVLPVATAASPAAARTGPSASHTPTRRRATTHQATASAIPPITTMAMTIELREEPNLGGQLAGERRDHRDVEEPRGGLHRGGPGSPQGQ